MRLLRVMDEVHTIVSGTRELEPMLQALLHHMLEILDCDRAWLLYPCDPFTSSWSVPMEQTRPEWPGAFARNLQIPMEPGVRFVFEAALDSDAPVTFDEASEFQVPGTVTEQFGVHSQMALAVHPKTDQPWMLGVHHCRGPHIYSEEERTIFAGIGRRLGDALSTLIVLRDLRRSEANLEAAVVERTAQLERANADLKAFSHSVSHDLRTPIRSVRTYGELLHEQLGAGLDDVAAKYLGRVLEGAERMEKIVGSLLRLSEATDAQLELEPVDISAMAMEVAGVLVVASLAAAGVKLDALEVVALKVVLVIEVLTAATVKLAALDP